ncbi:MAG: hypothetical protein FH751_12365 [Firmicutes bacterium]|nr:hypothetical protein [Bacillota bacterium]
MIIGFISIFLLLILIDLPKLKKSNLNTKYIMVYFFITLLSFGLGLLLIVKPNIPSIYEIVNTIIPLFPKALK